MSLVVAVELNLDLEQMDFKTTFLYEDFEEIIYMKQLEGFEVGDKKDCIYKLNRSLYSLKQSPRQWNKRFEQFIASIGFESSKYDTSIYFKFLEDLFIVLLLHIDDILIVSNNKLEV